MRTIWQPAERPAFGVVAANTYLLIFTILMFAILLPRPAGAQDGQAADLEIGPLAASVAAQIEAGFEPGEADAFRALLADPAAGVTAPTLGHLMYLGRYFDRAAWFFAMAVAADPDDAPQLNNAAAMLAELHAADPGAHPDAWLKIALRAGQAAVARDPAMAAYHNTVGQAARRLAQAADPADAGLLARAVEALTQATALAPDEPLYWSNLAEAQAASGNAAGAAAAIAQARALDPNHPATLWGLRALGRDPAAAAAIAAALAPVCAVDFGCDRICPGGIVGRIMMVTCEMESAGAQLSCLAGEPYATTYRCEEEIPEYGILIPGLNAGFSVAVPGFSLHVLVDGDGTIRARVEGGVSLGPVSAYARADGRYQPGGGISFDDFTNVGGGVRLSLINNSPAASLASDLGHPPAHIELERVGEAPTQINAEAYNAGVISF